MVFSCSLVTELYQTKRRQQNNYNRNTTNCSDDDDNNNNDVDDDDDDDDDHSPLMGLVYQMPSTIMCTYQSYHDDTGQSD